VTWWAGVARGFEVPTAVELATSPDTARGFNDALRPASSWQLEVGRRGTLGDRAVVEAVAFVADVRDEFVSRTVVIPGIAQPRAFFENAAGARRAGVEVAGTLLTTASTQVGLAYAWSDFRFRAFRAGVVNAQFGTDSVDHSGNQLPAVAPHRLTVEGRWRPASGVALAGWVEWASRTWVDNGNTAAGTLYQRTGGAQPTGLAIPFRAAPSIAQLHLSASWRAGAATFFATGDNLLGARWISSISPNATNGRFYFPGPGRTVAVGVALGALRP
jgi:iron complex outermembrane receptor protein